MATHDTPVIDRKVAKLVNDGTAALVGGDGTVTYEILAAPEHLKWLRRKLIEEAHEAALSDDMRELGQLYLLLDAIAHVAHGRTIKDVRQQAAVIEAQRGGYRSGVAMVINHPQPTKPNGPDAGAQPDRELA